MADAWDDSDDDWDKDSDSDDELNARLGKITLAPKTASSAGLAAPEFDDEEEDLAVAEAKEVERLSKIKLKTKGNALALKKQKELAEKEELEVARRAMALESEMESNMTAEERKMYQREREEEADSELVDDLFGGAGMRPNANTKKNEEDVLVMKDLKSHLKHARKVAQCMKEHKKSHLASAFLKELLQECKDVIDDDAIGDIIKTCNVIKNDKVAASKKKVKGQAQKSKKDKLAEKKARKVLEDTFGDNDIYDDYDAYGQEYEDDFF